MEPGDNNPYSAPSADLDTETSPDQRMRSLPYFSCWYVFGLSIITLGLYYPYWMFTRSRIINQVHDQPVSMNLVFVVIGLIILSQITAFMSGMESDNTNYQNLSNLTSIASSIANLFWVFSVRNRIHQMASASKEGFWLNVVLTFFLQVIYLQYKINEYHEKQYPQTSMAV